MLQLPHIPLLNPHLSIEEYNLTSSKKISKESFAKYKKAIEMLYEFQDYFLPRITIVISIIIAELILIVCYKETLEWWMWIIGSVFYGVTVGLLIYFPLSLLLNIPLDIIGKVINKEYAAEIDYRDKRNKRNTDYSHIITQLSERIGFTNEQIENAYKTPHPQLDCFEAQQQWVKLYEQYLHNKAESAKKSFWENLGSNGREFEKEIAKFFERKGYLVQLTPQSNDGGVDVILKDNGNVTYVQCKQYSTPIGIAVARELYGVMCADKVECGIIATLNGVNENTKKFCEKHNIIVLTTNDYVTKEKTIATPIDQQKLRTAYLENKYTEYKDLWIGGLQYTSIEEVRDNIRECQFPYGAITKQRLTKPYSYEKFVYGVIGSFKPIFEDMKLDCNIVELAYANDGNVKFVNAKPTYTPSKTDRRSTKWHRYRGYKW